MTGLTRLLLTTLLLVSISSPLRASDGFGRRIALVIGNSAYMHTAPVENPRNDAADITATLKELGFQVFGGRDLDKAAMDGLIRNFAESLAGAQMGLFFYAGHGLQVGGQNYLVPVDAKLSSAVALDFETVRLELVQRTMERAVNTNIIILDACRDNPLARNLARALGTRSSAVGRGLAAMESGEGTLISFSTQPGNVALDGAGRNSPFAEGLLKHIRTPGDDLPSILINVRNHVMAATARRQVPWEHSALTAKVYFTPPKSKGPTAEQQMELAFWASVKDSSNAAVIATYLERYPKGEFAPVARALVEHYESRRKLEQAKQDDDLKRQAHAAMAAQAKRMEEERRATEAAAASGASSAGTPTDDSEAKRLHAEQEALAAKRAEQLRAAQQEARLAREAAEAAERQRHAAVKAAEAATKAAEVAVAKAKERTTKVAAPRKLEDVGDRPPHLNGTWTISSRTTNGTCLSSGSSFIRISNGVIGQGAPFAVSGHVTGNGSATWTSAVPGTRRYRGTFRGNSGSGTFVNEGRKCTGVFTARRN
jgi:uncharacterized caspase-like protein